MINFASEGKSTLDIKDSLFEGKTVCLAPIDHDKDPEVESKWTHDPDYLRLLNPQPIRPLSPAQVKKKYEAIEKEVEETKNLFYFTIRRREDDRLVGFARLYWIEWTNSNGFVQLGIGNPADRGRGYGSQALQMLLRYAFTELNLYRLTAIIAGYNPAALHLFNKFGFAEEVRRRQALNRDGQRWDAIHLGILHNEWGTLQGGNA
jgi:RimJ/RimL family protein N-acetyltransferase